jgi:hypothetical protein
MAIPPTDIQIFFTNYDIKKFYAKIFPVVVYQHQIPSFYFPQGTVQNWSDNIITQV